mmetsp:Transcript_19661/g.62530  ORF Transcript_19661/g.62530 Transcript_19661/m.62530 type:complete len:450 (+) Transcript_19661:366-1715(+)|eukprot:CAMPEP_0182913758 /NCGR_PEP_ID=MMETSP0034_2-20130328/38201_1 /TAXON_ID=156128 /ORGANISM="Nephroselmis pyriformis, Strain CCMP717" /LENGTH=449 /DNA_ID=CAMNT_0025050487 /DNA_START=312 /DNA_END=1661 /DNA_ORIENTATION=+
MISQFYILSLRGDALISQEYLDDVTGSSKEIFFRKVKEWKLADEEAPPVFYHDGVSYLHVKTPQMYFVATTTENESPSMVLELLTRICGLVKDICGVLNEDGVRKNIILIYELLSEVMDFGCVQLTAMESLKQLILNQPIAPSLPVNRSGRSIPGMRTPIATQKSVMASKDPRKVHREEIFVDIIENITLTFNASGYIQHSEIDGTINMKSFLSGNPPIKIKLNDDLTVGVTAEVGAFEGMGVHLDDCNFHESVNVDEFDTERSLTLVPPEGEFAMMNYRSTQKFKPPFRVSFSMDEIQSGQIMVGMKLKADFDPKFTATGVTLHCPMPESTLRVASKLQEGGKNLQAVEFRERDKMLTWTFKRCQGGTDHLLEAKLTLPSGANTFAARKEIGPVTLEFSVPMYNISKLAVKYLMIHNGAKGKGGKSEFNRWLRYVTNSRNYVVRVGER